MTGDILAWILIWFEKNTTVQKDEILAGTGESYFEKGWIDSFQFIEFVSSIEEEYGISFSNDEFQDRKFSTIEGLAQIIRRKLDAQG
ncbi:MAG: acyl carrier protein [Methanoregula sp.]|jgi:D-alanine--poly(phosphoribitol) ligase subunit 2|uniref:acyl carrier protein n=1 Tax=Methanoregula sp. TaxID=2052170 RepID=UPI003D0FE75F